METGKCPYLEECERDVDKAHAEHLCNDQWFLCGYARYRMQHASMSLIPKNKPRNWMEQQKKLET